MSALSSLAYGLANPLAAFGATAAAPTAGTAVASIAAPPAGKYRVTVVTRQSGTVDTNEVNMSLRLGSVVLLPLTSRGVQGQEVELADVVCDGSGTLNVVTGATNAGAGAVYNACIVAVRVA